MNKFDASSINTEEDGEHGNPSRSGYYEPSITNYDGRLAELELENSRLHRLVAELLIKNQQLRKPD